MKDVTIILPYSNNEQTLRKSIDSVIHQTHNSWELILIDDAGNDNSFSIATSVAEKTKEIKFIRNRKPVGMKASMNLGLQRATSPFVLFLYPFDQLPPDTCKQLLTAATVNGADISFGETWWKICDGILIPVKEFYKFYKTKQSDNFRNSCSFPFAIPSVNGKLFKHQYLTKYDISLAEDSLANYDSFSLFSWYYADTIIKTDSITYFQCDWSSSYSNFALVFEKIQTTKKLLQFSSINSLDEIYNSILTLSLSKIIEEICTITDPSCKQKAIELLVIFIENFQIDDEIIKNSTSLSTDEIKKYLIKIDSTDYRFRSIKYSLQNKLDQVK